MKASVVVDSTPVGRSPNEIVELDLIGTVQKEGYIDYGFEGMMGYHNNVVQYFRYAAEEGKLTVVFSVTRPLAASALHKLFTLAGRVVRKVVVISRRDDGTLYASLELNPATITSLTHVTVESGPLYLLSLTAAKGKGTVVQTNCGSNVSACA